MNSIDKESKYLRAQERVRKEKKFYSGLVGNLFVIVLTAGINYYTNQWKYPWFLWVVFGVSVGTIFKAIKLFGYNSLFGKNWEEKKIKEFMDKDVEQEKWN